MIAIVGNGPLSPTDRASIAKARRIVRFNLTPNLSEEPEARTDELFLSCSSKQIGDFLSRGRYLSDKAFGQASRIVLPYHPNIIRQYMKPPSLLSRLKGRRADWTNYCLDIADDEGKYAEILPEDLYHEACGALEIDPTAKEFFPSSGLLAVLRELQHPSHEIHLYGFGFVGWKRHRWEQEKSTITKFENAGRLTLHPVG
jgi:hypothetical protein